jgi:replication factor C subunit 1
MKILQQQKKSDSPIKSSPKKRHSSATSQQQATFPAKRPKILLVDSSHEKDQKPAVVAAKVASTAVLPWVEKYKPTSLKQLIGQQTDKSPANKLFDWLKNWARYHLTPSAPGDKKKRNRKNGRIILCL